MKNFKTFTSFLLLLFLSLSALAQDKSAYEIWNDMTEAAINFKDEKILVKGAEEVKSFDNANKLIENAGQMVMFGGEKEGSSALITRVMGPSAPAFQQWVDGLPKDTKERFLRGFLNDFVRGQSREKIVKDVNGKVIPFNLEGLTGIDYLSISSKELDQKFKLYLERGGDRHFSHLKKQARMNIFNGKFGGLTPEHGMKKKVSYSSYKPLYGKAQKFMDAAHGTSVGWEVNFLPQRSYGEFEEMIDWFRTELKNVGQKFEAPGHQWVVYPKSKKVISSPEEELKMIQKLGEVQKNSQAYIVLKSIEGNAGIELASFKGVQPDGYLIRGHSTGRGVIRLENSRFKVDGQDAFAIEYRAGVKNDKNRRMTQKFLVSRYAADEFDDLALGDSWTLKKMDNIGNSELMRRFGVSNLEAKKFMENVSGVSIADNRANWNSTKSISKDYLVPLWNWEDAPYLSAGKKAELRNLTRTYIKSVANIHNPDMSSVRLALRDWATTSRLSHDIENYLKPKQIISDLDNAHIFKSTGSVDVNKIDLGIEYSARFPLKTNADFIEVPGQTKKFEWQKTYFDYTDKERTEVIRKFAQSLGKELNDGKDVTVTHLKSDGHGHGLDIAFEVKDKEGKKWRVEWDGIGRNYDVDSKMIKESIRGGHIEIVTPKFQPSADAMKKLYSAMEKENLIPQTRFGGGHINIDLAPFEGKPKKMARFLGTYLDNRNVMSMMFQHPGRTIGAEPFEVSQRVINRLKNFNGTEEELKQLLYNEKFFNTRVGRKTKNSQINLTAYFQDVIPEEFIHEDFDMKNDIWRRTFDVDPKIRKMEFRMFNAPRNQAESALQIKFTKALLNKALNESDAVFTNSPDVDYVKMLNNPELAFKEFEKTMQNLGLDPKEYKGFFLEGLENTKNMVEAPHYLPVKERLKMHPEVRDWKAAVNQREIPIGSEGRHWGGDDILPEAKVYAQQQMIAREAAEQRKPYLNTNGKLNRTLETIPLEVTLNLDDIKKLEPHDQLVALYFKKPKQNGPYKKLLTEIIKSDDYPASVYNILSSDELVSDGFSRFLVENLPAKYKQGQSQKILHSYAKLLESQNPELRKLGRNYLLSHHVGVKKLLEFSSFDSRSLTSIGEILADIDNNKLKRLDVTEDFVTYLSNIGKKVDDPKSVRHLFNFVSKLSPEDRRKIYLSYLKEASGKVKETSGMLVKKYFPQDYYFHARKSFLQSNLSPQKKELYGKFLNTQNVFDNMKPKDLFQLPEGDRLIAARELYFSKGASVGQKSAITKELRKPEYFQELRNTILWEGKDPALSEWAFEKIKDHPTYKKLDITQMDDFNLYAEIIEELSNSGSTKLHDEALNLAKMSNMPELVGAYASTTIMSPYAPQDSKIKAYKHLLDNPELMKGISQSDPESIQRLVSYIDFDIKHNKSMRLGASKLLSHLALEGNGKKYATNIILKMAKDKDPDVRSISYILQGNKNTKDINKLLPTLLSDDNVTKLQSKSIKLGMDKHNKFIKNLNTKALAEMDAENKLWYLYKHSEATGEVKLLSTIRDDEAVLNEMIKVLRESADSGKANPYGEYVYKALQDHQLKKILANNPDKLQDLAYYGLTSKDPAVRNQALKFLEANDQKLMDIIAKDIRLQKFDDEFVKEIFSKVDVNAANIEITKTSLNSADLQDNLVRGLAKAEDPKARTILSSFIKEVPGHEIDKAILKNIDNLKNSKQVSVILKDRNSSYAFSSLAELQKSEIPIVKKNGTEGAKNIISKSQSLKNFDGLDIEEKMNLLYRRNTGSRKIDDITVQLAKFSKDPEFKAHLLQVIESKDFPDNYKRWAIGLFESKDNIKALGFKRDDIKDIMDAAMKSDSPVSQKAGLELIRNDSVIAAKDKIKSIGKMRKQSAESIDTLKLLAKTSPNNPLLIDVLKLQLVDDYYYTIKSGLHTKAAELMMMLPRGSVEEIIKYADDSWVWDDKALKSLLLAASKHESYVIAEYAKQYVTHSDPQLAKIAKKIHDNWEKKSALGKIANRAGCVGRSVRNVLNRLTFR